MPASLPKASLRIAIVAAAVGVVATARAQSAPPPPPGAVPTEAFPLESPAAAPKKQTGVAAPLPPQPPPPPQALAPTPPSLPGSPRGSLTSEPEPWNPLPARVDERREPARRWYGGEVIATDAAAITLTVVAAKADALELLLPAFAGYMLGGPIVHWAEGHPGKSVGSLALRTCPVALTALALQSESYSLAVVSAFSAVPVMIIDATAIAWEDAPPEPRASFTAFPSVVVSDTTIAASLSGTF